MYRKLIRIFVMKTLKQTLMSNKKMKYTIYLSARSKGLQLLNLTEDEKNELLKEESLDSVYLDWVEKKDEEYTLEGEFLCSDVDRYYLSVEDEEGNTVYESEEVDDLLDNDRTYLDEDLEETIEGYEFVGIGDGFYLVRMQVIKGCSYTCELEIEEPFDATKLYVIRDMFVNDELMGDTVFPITAVYYLRGNTPDPTTDNLDWDYDGDHEEQYYDTYLYEVSDKDYWNCLK